MLILNILDILKRYSDENHRLSQKDIKEILETEYEMKVDRKSVKRNLMDLVEFGYDIEYSESVRKNSNQIEETMLTDWYLNRDFQDSEIRLLIDSLLFSKHIPYSQCKALIEKLKNLSNQYFNAKVKHICNLPETMPSNQQLFYTIEVLDEAINKGKQVSFSYSNYDIDKKLHPRLTGKGKERTYRINPYQMVATNGRYYLICNNQAYDNISHYRVDRISNIKLVDHKTKDRSLVKGLENGLDLPKHMAEHIYMFAGESVMVRFRADRSIVSDIIDWLGTDIEFSNEFESEVEANVRVNENAFTLWSLQYGQYIEVIEPSSIRERIKAAVNEMGLKYL